MAAAALGIVGTTPVTLFVALLLLLPVETETVADANVLLLALVLTVMRPFAADRMLLLVL